MTAPRIEDLNPTQQALVRVLADIAKRQQTGTSTGLPAKRP